MIEPDRFVDPKTSDVSEEGIERALRPKDLSEYVGQEKTRNQLKIFIDAANKRKEALDHVLLFGPPGLGKTTLAHIIAKEMGVNLRQTSGPVLEKTGDLAAAKSPVFSRTGPDVCLKLTPISFAIICAKVVLPKPGGPNNKTWSNASFRLLAASIKIFN